MVIKQIKYFKHASGLEYHNYWILFEDDRPILIEKYERDIYKILGIDQIKGGNNDGSIREKDGTFCSTSGDICNRLGVAAV